MPKLNVYRKTLEDATYMIFLLEEKHSVFKNDKSWCPKIFLEDCKYKVKEETTKIVDDLTDTDSEKE